MHDYILECPASKRMLSSIARFERKAFGSDATPLMQLSDFWSKNAYQVIALRSGDKLVAYSLFEILNKRGSEIVRSGVLVDKRLNASHTLNPRYMHKASAIYFDGIGALGRGDERDRRVAAIMYARASLIEKALRLPIRAYAIAATRNGARLIRSYGGKKIASGALRTKRKYALFEIMITREWCRSVKKRASKRLSGIEFEFAFERKRNTKT